MTANQKDNMLKELEQLWDKHNIAATLNGGKFPKAYIRAVNKLIKKYR